MTSWIADARYSVRRLLKRPGYSLLAMLTLALGVGGTASTYGIVRGVLFDTLHIYMRLKLECSGRRPTGPKRSFSSSVDAFRVFAMLRCNANGT